MNDIIGESSFTSWMQFGGAMLGNTGVYLFGVLWSASRHDSMPGYMELRIEKKNLEKEYNRVYTKEVTGNIRQKRHKAEQESDAKRKADNAYKTLPGYHECYKQLQQFKAKDAVVHGLLGAYRSELLKEARENSARLTFIVSGIDLDGLPKNDTTEIRYLTPEEYLGISFRFKYLTK